MIQQIIGLIIIIFFIYRLIRQRKRNEINGQEFIFWIIFWVIAALAVVFIKGIDILVASLGFSGSGIEVLLYVGMVISFYLIFRLRLRQAKIEKDITLIIRNLAQKNLGNNK
jgi:small membrane protein